MTITPTTSSFRALQFTLLISLSKSFPVPPFQKALVPPIRELPSFRQHRPGHCHLDKNFSNLYSSFRQFSSSSSPSSRSSLVTMKSNLLSISECIQRHQSSSSSPPTVFLDGSWHLSPSRNARQEYESGPRIPGAHFFDIDNVATQGTNDNKTKLPHMMPPKELFAHVMDEFGITSNTNVILYGTEGCFSIPRVLYTFKAMGHPIENVKMMNGSLKDWMDAGGPVEWGWKESMKVDNHLVPGGDYVSRYDKAVDARNVVNMDKIVELVQNTKNGTGTGTTGVIVDARSKGRFVGKEPEPRKGLRGGHMPGAFNVPFDRLLKDDKKTLRSKEEMISIFSNAGVDVYTEKDIICSCGSGVTACWIALALEECGRDPSRTFVYDGSWIEWASDERNPVVKED